ncbi:MAG TPA: hydantoinase/oxoprolinase family protein [Gaiellaceae bacterium]|nr:hydantoinase/oxoprolinase family protein [Gaiellaceae bacterium]
MDVGGTFTDVVLYDDSGTATLARTKVLTSAERPGEVIKEAFAVLGVAPEELELFIHATTLITNLIIERRGATVGLLTTKGFRDVLEIGLSYRPEPYNLQREKTSPLVPRPLRRELDERVGPRGDVIRPLDPAAALREVEALADLGADAIAISLLHSYANPVHERLARDAIAGAHPDLLVSISSEIDPQVREYERTSSTVLNAYAMPAVASYLDKLERDVATPAKSSFYMHSGGGVVPPAHVRARPIDLVLSGPSAGVLAASYLGEQLGLQDLMTFDIGGTSCDVCLIEDGHARERDAIDVEWGVPLRVRCIDVISVGAGGGSIAWVDVGGALRIGPQSAGAHPGPACYGFGGVEPTVTDANLVLGLLDPNRFLGGRIVLDLEAARRSLAGVAATLGVGEAEAAEGIHRIATANMAQAVRAITVQKGIDPRKFVLVAFGGAGGQHAIAVATEMEIRSVLFPPLASTLSAFGLLTADLKTTEQRAYLQPLAGEMADTKPLFVDLRRQALESLGLAADAEVAERRFCQIRYVGQTHELAVPLPEEGWSAMPAAFEDAHERMYGTRLGDPLEVVALGVTVVRMLPKLSLPPFRPDHGDAGLEPTQIQGLGAVASLSRPQLAPGTEVVGPCVLYEVDSTIFVPAGWQGRVGAFGEILCSTG